jgi:hypothetical protein
MDVCPKSLGDSSTYAALKVVDCKNITTGPCYILNINLGKICHFPELRISQKLFIFNNFFKKCVKNFTTITVRGPF